MNDIPNTNPKSAHFLPAWEAFETIDANQLPPEEQMARFLVWLKVHDAGHQPC